MFRDRNNRQRPWLVWLALAAACGLFLSSAAAYSAVGSDLLGETTGVLTRAKSAVCRYNVALVENAVEIFLIQHSKPPVRMDDLYRESFTRPPRCPAGGVFWLGSGGRVYCSEHDCPLLRSLGTYEVLPSGATESSSRLSFRSQAAGVRLIARWRDVAPAAQLEIRWSDPAGRVLRVEHLGLRAAARPRVDSLLTLAVVAHMQHRTQPQTGEYRVELLVNGRPISDCAFWITD